MLTFLKGILYLGFVAFGFVLVIGLIQSEHVRDLAVLLVWLWVLRGAIAYLEKRDAREVDDASQGPQR